MKKNAVLPFEILSVQRHISELDLQVDFPSWWEPLHSITSNEVVFLSKDWIATWLEIYGARFEGKWVWWSYNEKVVGGCLLLIKPIRIGPLFFRTIFLNASGATLDRSPLAECNDILCVAGFEDAIAKDMSALLSEMDWDRLVLTAASNDGVMHRIVTTAPLIAAKIEHKPAPYISFPDLPDEPFDRRLTSNTRNQVNRCRRIYESMGGSISVTLAEDLETAMQYFEEMAQMHNARWVAKGLAGSFSNQLAIEFHRKLIRRIWSSGTVDLLYVKAGEISVGVLYNFIGAGRVYFFQSGFAYQRNNQLKPGLLTHCLAIENYRCRGFREYDFLAGDSRYKRSLSTHERSLFWATIYGSTFLGRLLSWTYKIKTMLRKYKVKFASVFRKKSNYHNSCLWVYSLLNLESVNTSWFAYIHPALP